MNRLAHGIVSTVGALSALLIAHSPANAQAMPGSVLQQQRVDLGTAVVLPDVTYSRVPGYRPLKMDLYLPKQATGPAPVVMWLHGGAWAGGDARGGIFATADWPKQAAELASHGYVVASVTYRLSNESDFPEPLHDVKNAMRWLRGHATEYGASADKLVLMGGSAGGYLAALAGVTCGVTELEPPVIPPMGMPGGPPPPPPPAGPLPSDCATALVLFYPVVELQVLGKLPGPGGQSNSDANSPIGRLLGCGLDSCSATKLAQSSVLGQVDAKDPPTLMFHGDADTLVPITQSQALLAALKAKGVSAELVTVPGAKHVFPGLSAEAQKGILDKTLQFIQQQTRGR